MAIYYILFIWLVVIFGIIVGVVRAKRCSNQPFSGNGSGGGEQRKVDVRGNGSVASLAGWQNQVVQVQSGGQDEQLNQREQGGRMGQMGQRGQGDERGLMSQGRQSGHAGLSGGQNQGGQGHNYQIHKNSQNGQNGQNNQNSQVDRTGYAAQIADNDYGSAADHRLEVANQAKDRAKKRKEMAEVHKGSETTMEEWAQVQKKKKIGYEGRPESKPSFLGGDVERADRIPDGTTVIHCSYCGAGNLVPIGKEVKYHCYFCWERLEK